MRQQENDTRIQSTCHIAMCEPVKFYANPQTLADNTYQSGAEMGDLPAIQRTAVAEMHNFRDALTSHGVLVSTYRGQEGAPDDVFCNNWVSTDQDKSLIYYPLHVPNRRLERRADIMQWLEQTYRVQADLTHYEQKNAALESTGSLCLDRVNRIAYCALSQRADRHVVEDWAQQAGYTLHAFDTQTQSGKPVYHTNVMLFIGTAYAAVCADLIVAEDRQRVIDALAQTHEVILLSEEQIGHFCGNCLEVRSTDGKRYLAMSAQARAHFTPEQLARFAALTDGIIAADIATIERYGGGSARCMLLELF